MLRTAYQYNCSNSSNTGDISNSRRSKSNRIRRVIPSTSSERLVYIPEQSAVTKSHELQPQQLYKQKQQGRITASPEVSRFFTTSSLATESSLFPKSNSYHSQNDERHKHEHHKQRWDSLRNNKNDHQITQLSALSSSTQYSNEYFLRQCKSTVYEGTKSNITVNSNALSTLLNLRGTYDYSHRSLSSIFHSMMHRWCRNGPYLVVAAAFVVTSTLQQQHQSHQQRPSVVLAESSSNNNNSPWISRLFGSTNGAPPSTASATTGNSRDIPNDSKNSNIDEKSKGNNMKQPQDASHSIGRISMMQSMISTENDNGGQPSSSSCSYYGCVMKPIDVHYSNDPDLKRSLEFMRSATRNVVATSESAKHLAMKNIATTEAVTLTLIGYKGGIMSEQVNQDRSIIVSPYNIGAISSIFDEGRSPKDKDSSSVLEQFLTTDRVLLGVFDGHAPLGEGVSEFAATNLPPLLADKLKQRLLAIRYSEMGSIISTLDEITITKEALEETFVELDKTAPADVSGGCTATVVLSQGKHVYIANAGDSRSFIVTYRPSTNVSTVVAISREDKPSLPDEKERVERMGGEVYVPARGTSRVVYHDPMSGVPTGLAMSRSIGDWAAGKLGVIPNPLVQVFNIDEIVKQQLLNDSQLDATATSTTTSVVVDANGFVTKSFNANDMDDVYIFAVCATDGMMDYMEASEIGRVLGHSLFAPTGAHPVAVTEHLVFAAANAWYHAKQGRYRDDIAIAVATIRKPPLSSSSTRSISVLSDSTTTMTNVPLKSNL